MKPDKRESAPVLISFGNYGSIGTDPISPKIENIREFSLTSTPRYPSFPTLLLLQFSTPHFRPEFPFET